MRRLHMIVALMVAGLMAGALYQAPPVGAIDYGNQDHRGWKYKKKKPPRKYS